MKMFRLYATKEIDYSMIVMANSEEQAKDIADTMETTEWETWDHMTGWQENGGESFTIYDIDDLQDAAMQKIKKISDHELAALLRKYKAIDNYKKEGNTNKWCDDDGRLIAIAFYDNSKCLRQVYLPDYVIYQGKPVIKENSPKKSRRAQS